MWTRWHSIKYNDGRRPSAQGYNQSKWHFVPPGQISEPRHAEAALCGKEVQIPYDRTFKTSGECDPKYGFCSVCVRKRKELPHEQNRSGTRESVAKA
jgi:hypothetical protein